MMCACSPESQPHPGLHQKKQVEGGVEERNNTIRNNTKTPTFHWAEYRETVWVARNQNRQPKVQIELNLARDIKDNKINFYKYVRDKGKARKDMGPLQKETRDLITWDMEKAELLNAFFALVFTGKDSNHTSQVAEGKNRGYENK
ncbi:hypothetical protein llap_1415 [Limosa lapponica baueri]|uniref:Rna-directed dna polymerase from mobile element jockey-like n=1 Tax=Limosa lapponica baueri TaxID=1758121 RepID=A0A2I0UQJ0_LIMLA|nr:hypothetical protein llap_1415 [Limosa lapponica baueri]